MKYLILFFLAFMGQVGTDLNRSPASISSVNKSCIDLLSSFVSRESFDNKSINLPITLGDNLNFINIIKNKSYRQNEIFWHLDNTVLKALNDKVYHDKEITHGITIFFQETMLQKIIKNKLLSQKLLAKYFDYKTLRLSFLDLNQELLAKEMLKIFNEANKELEIYLKERKLDVGLRNAPFLARNFHNWFAQGIAEKPDLASLVARLARSQSQDNLIKVYSYKESKNILKMQFETTQKLNIQITHLLNYDPKGFIWSEVELDGKKVRSLSRDFLDLIRKSDFFSIEGRDEALIKINHFTGGSLREKNLGELIQFINNLDYFSISILQNETKKIDWALSNKGFMSVDFTKKGAEGLQWVHANLQQSRSVDEMMERGRNAFWIVNQSISDGVKELSQMISKNYYQSGDDLVLFFNEYKRNTKILDKLLEVLHYPQVSGLRVVFFRGQLNRSSGDLLRDAGEVFLKQYRSDLDWKLARNSQDDIITFVEVENTHSGILKKVFYRVINKELESEIEKWHESFPSDIEFVKI